MVVLFAPTVSAEDAPPSDTPPAAANEPRATALPFPTARVPLLVKAPLTALATSTVRVTPALIVIVSAVVGCPLVPDPVVIWLKFILDEITMAESVNAWVATSPVERPVAVSRSLAFAYWRSTYHDVSTWPLATASRSG